MQAKSHTSYQIIQIQRRRINFLISLIFLVPIIIFSKLVYLQVYQYEYYVSYAEKQQWAEDTIQPKRGNIYVKETDGSYYPLATNIKLNLVYAAPGKCKDQEETAASLSVILGIEKEEILEKFKYSSYYAPIKRKLTEDESNKIRELKDEAVGLREENWRVYPENSLASQVLGYVDAEGEGRYGLEQFFNEELKGTPGLYKVEVDSSGNKIAIGSDVSVPAKDGQDIVLTINRDIQAQVESILESAVKKHGAEGGSVIVLNPKSGEILAMANYPTFDPNRYTEVTDYSLFRNSATENLYEPGSIFKVLTMAAGLDAGKIEPESTFDDTGELTLNGYTIKNSDLKAHGVRDMTYVLEQSLNTGSAHIGQLLGKDLFYKYLSEFGLGMISGVESLSEQAGKLYRPEEVNDHTYATISFGQSISATPLQLTVAFAAIANGGKMMKPHFLAEKKNGEKVEPYQAPEPKEVISESAAAKLSKMMVSVVEKGHGGQAKVLGYSVAGKTGTAQVPKKDGIGYEVGKNIGSFIGFAPALAPEFVVLAKIDSPKGVTWAESTAAPVVGEVLAKALNYYQVPPIEL